MAAPVKRSPQAPIVAIVAGITIVALALRLPSFGDSLWGDEVSTNYVVHGFGMGSFLDILRSDQEGTPPLFFALTWLTKGFDGVEGLRVVSLLAGLAAIPLTYLLGERTVGRPAAIVGAALVALSPFQIFYATEARAYALMMLCCLLASLTLLIALDSGRSRWWVAYGLSVAAAAYTHYTSLFVLIALFGWAFFARPEARKPLILANLGAALLFAPWVPELLDDRHEAAANALEKLRPQTLHTVWDDLVHWSIGYPFVEVSHLPGNLALWLMAAGVLLGAIGLFLRWRREGDGSSSPQPSGLALVLALAVAAPVGAVLAHLAGPTVFAPRNIISSWPGLALAAGALVTAGRAPLRYAAAGLLLGGFAIGAVKMLDAGNQRPDYAGAADYIEENGSPSSPVVDWISLTPGPQTMLEAALAPKGEAGPPDRQVLTLGFPSLEGRLAVRREGRSVLTRLPVPSDQEVADQAARAAGSGTLFLVTGGASLDALRRAPGPVADLLAALPPRFHEVESRNFQGVGLTGITVHVLSGSPAPTGQ
jgi:mannosyltransferase